ncbi:hypothetical protein A2850_01980 [Candidatus Azambacteria bacterium RIFCSPHIGHO2_01_FULL_51_74]|nr:MAG: hypothetical protein A2850_01980 [Candidatus Azambacteria bacterium RIFCSPHIGHO2_01_FULL_51_74]
MNYSEPFNYSLNWQATSPCGAGGLVCPPTGFISVNQGGSVLAAFDAIQTAGMTFENISFDYGPKTNGISVSPFSLSSCNDATSCSGVTATMRTTFTGGAGDTPTGNYTITITGTSATSGIIKTITFNLTVTAGFNFSLSLNNTSGSAYVNETASPLPTLTTTYVSGTSGTVSYSIVNPNPTNITIAPSTLASHTFTASGETYPAGGQLFTISVSNAISLGTYIIPMTGTSDSGLSKTVYYSLTVYGAFDFAFTWDTTSPCTGAASCSDTIYQGSSASGNSGVVAYNSPLARTVNFSNTVVNTSTGLAEPSITVSIPASCATTCILPVLISTGANTPATPSGTPYTVAITGDDGSGVAHSITYNLTVKLPPTNYNMMGWAWSDNIGWISFNAQNCDTDWDGFSDGGNAGCPVAGTLIPNYGINLNLSTYELSGEAWNNEIGWITFTRSFATNGQCAGGITTECPPAAPYNTTSDAYIAELKDGKVQGWARATSGIGENWGWLALTGASYGVTNLGASDFQGWAWGGDVMGWISFNSINCDADTDGLIDASCGANAGKTAYPYKVWVRGTLPCSPPTATSLSSNFLDRCGQPYNPTLSFTYKDSQLNPLLQYTIKIYDYACDTNKDAVIDGSAPGYCATNPFPTDTYVYAGSPIATNALGLANVDYQYNGASKLDYNKSYYFTVTVQSICNLD